MRITGPQARAARALVEWPRPHVAKRAALDEAAVEAFENGFGDLGDEENQRLRQVLEGGGAVFLDENGGGLGVRLRFTQKEVRSIARLENEGGPVGDDDV